MTPKPTRTLDDVILYPEEDEKLVQAKCTECNCINAFWKDLPEYERFIQKGYGLKPVRGCIKLNCACHRGNGKLPRILIREVPMDVALGVKNG